jgi:hypothetical protein
MNKEKEQTLVQTNNYNWLQIWNLEYLLNMFFKEYGHSNATDIGKYRTLPHPSLLS